MKTREAFHRYLNTVLILALILSLRVSYGSGTGQGVAASQFPLRVASGRQAGLVNVAAGTVVTFTPAADGTYKVEGIITYVTTTSPSWTLNTRVNWTDENSIPHSIAPSQYNSSSGWNYQTTLNSGTSSVGVYPFSGQYLMRVKGGTAITVTETGGVYTTINYTIEANITQVT